MRRLLSVRVILTGLLLLPVLYLPTNAHKIKSHLKMDGHVEIKEHTVQAEVHIRWPSLMKMIDVRERDLDPFELSLKDKELLRNKIERLIREQYPVRINGLKVEPVVDDVWYNFHVYQEFVAIAQVYLSYSVKGKLRYVEFTWKPFQEKRSNAEEDRETEKLQQIPLTIQSNGNKRNVALTPDAPVYTWRAPGTSGDYDISTVTGVKKPDLISIPLPSVVLLGLVPIFLIAFRNYTNIRWGTTVVLMMLSVSLYSVGQVQVVPPWQASNDAPTEEEARELFRTLHQNIYRAFDYRTESDIYDTLARSCRGQYLDNIYIEIMRGLNPKNDSAAKTEVLTVNIRELDISQNPRKPDQFGARCLWRVIGTVHHWGHTHTRVNEYNAKFTVTNDGRSWKISGANVLKHRRVVKGNNGNQPVKDTGKLK